MVAGASRLGETSGPASDETLHLEEVPAFRMSSPKFRLPKYLELVLAPPPGCVEFAGWIQGWRGTGERHTLATFCEPSGFGPPLLIVIVILISASPFRLQHWELTMKIKIKKKLLNRQLPTP
jgi:hypothetical protein